MQFQSDQSQAIVTSDASDKSRDQKVIYCLNMLCGISYPTLSLVFDLFCCLLNYYSTDAS